jgi:hypothetical protein
MIRPIRSKTRIRLIMINGTTEISSLAKTSRMMPLINSIDPTLGGEGGLGHIVPSLTDSKANPVNPYCQPSM